MRHWRHSSHVPGSLRVKVNVDGVHRQFITMNEDRVRIT